MPIKNLLSASLIGAMSLAPMAVSAQQNTGAAGSEIRIGNLMPYTGALAAFAAIGRSQAAYFDMINERGGINGRKVKFFSMDDAYSAPKCVEATRRLVEQEEVLALYGSLGTAPQTAVHKYLNSKGVPQLLLKVAMTLLKKMTSKRIYSVAQAIVKRCIRSSITTQ